jgi:hypothetical protein
MSVTTRSCQYFCGLYSAAVFCVAGAPGAGFTFTFRSIFSGRPGVPVSSDALTV